MNQKTMHNNILKVVMAGLLCAVGIIIPMFSPLKIVIPPASFTVASHVAVFIAMFISLTVILLICTPSLCFIILDKLPASRSAYIRTQLSGRVPPQIHL